MKGIHVCNILMIDELDQMTYVVLMLTEWCPRTTNACLVGLQKAYSKSARRDVCVCAKWCMCFFHFGATEHP